MRWSSVRSCVLGTLLAASFSTSAQAQTQAQYDRLNDLAQFGIVSPMCQKLGFVVVPNLEDKIEPAVQREIETWDGDKERLKSTFKDAVGRQGTLFEVDLKYFSSHAKSDAELRNIKNVLMRYGRICQRAANDAFFKDFISAHAAYDLDRMATAASDEMLEGGGLASWQTPRITARGDIMMLAGACRRVIGPVQSDAVRQSYGRADDPRERAYYERSFDNGLNDTEMNPDWAQCQAGIARYRQKIAKAR